MATSNVARLLELLARGPATSSELTRALGVSQPTLSRLLRPLEKGGRVARLGTTRGARYGLSREVADVGASWPLFLIDEQGAPTEIASVHAIETDRYLVRGGPPRIQGIFEGIPYYLQDARPAGFLGRAIPAAHPELRLPPRVVDWTDAHVVTYLTQRGSESVGNLILGTEALDRYLNGEHGPRSVPTEQRPEVYPQLAAEAMSGAPSGSSAQGEHPKFSARVVDGNVVTQVLVKFSPPRTDAVGQRWADLLIAEHVAGGVLHDHGLPAARGELLEYGDQVFLQSERLRRVEDHGRRGVASLHSVDLDRHGMLDSWTNAGQRLRADGLLSTLDAERLALLDTFGALIANSDRHFGNVTLFDGYRGPFALAPTYDMLPMLFAPQVGQLIDRVFTPPGPTAATLAVWPRAREIALVYWERVNSDARISSEFRALGERCLDTVLGLGPLGTPRRRGA
jgi:DNA-binding transcriptional ArsR family regulator